jgi:hypothetical protein
LEQRNRLMDLAWQLQGQPAKKLEPKSIPNLTDAEHLVANIIATECELERERRRSAHGKVRQGLLGDEIDYVETLYWDELFQGFNVVQACAEQAKMTRTEIIMFAHEKCRPSNYWALFWMAQFFEVLDGRAHGEDFYRDVAQLLEKSVKHARQQAATKAARALHAPSNDAKKFVQDEWEKHAQAYDWNKSEFARHYVRRLLNERQVKVTEKQLRDVWLKDTRSARKQTGQRADG